jgi:SAM-dependent methyltransferase
MPILPSLLERLLVRCNLVPGPMLDFLGAEAFCALSAAQRLGVFDALRRAPRTAVEVARELGADARGTGQLLAALEATGYLEQRSGRFAPTRMTLRWVPALGEGVPFFEMLLDRLRDLEGTVRRGAPPVDAREWLDRRPNGWRDFQAGMIAIARMAAGEVAAKVRLPSTARTLLDVGGGHGLYSVELCRRHPRLSATVFDLPQSLPSAREVIAAGGMTARIAVRPGDFWQDDLGGGHDVALVFNIVHGNVAARNVELLRKVAAALAPGGLVAILDQVADAVHGRTAAAAAALSGLALFELAGGQTYAYPEIAGWLRAAGFEHPRKRSLRTLPGSSLILATKPPPTR